MAKLTIKDIAKALHISASTVSKALADSYEISEKTKKRVTQYAQKHNYSPNHSAKNLRRGKTNTVGVIASNISNTFISQVLQNIQIHFENNGAYTIIMQSHYDENTEKKCLENLIKRGVDGILIAPVKVNSNLTLLKKIQKERPVVLFDRIESSLATHKVGVDNKNGGFKATRHLLKKGKKNISIILAEGLGISEGRFEGYQKALQEYRIPFQKDNVLYVNLGNHKTLDKSIQEYITYKFKKRPPIDGVICASETISTRSLGIFAQMGVKVPQKLAVVGFANTSFAFSLNPPLTTILQPAEEMADIAAQKMLELLKNTTSSTSLKEYEKIELNNALIVRKSCGS